MTSILDYRIDRQTPVLRSGFIISRNADFLWFLALPYLAILAALACQQWLTHAAVASVALLITVPHHCATWIRAYGISEDRRRWRVQLFLGPVVILCLCFLGLKWAPITFVFIAFIWDHQHSLMQQHGFSRIYDFKSKTGAPSTGRFDLWMHWILFGNLVITSPNFTPVWLSSLYQFHLPLSVETVLTIHRISWLITIVYMTIYIGHLFWCASRGYSLNTVKYGFIASSYFLWYFMAWHTHSILVFSVAHRLMHGVQYIVISYIYTRHRTQKSTERNWAAPLVKPGNIAAFLLFCLMYAFLFQLITDAPLESFFFGAVRLPDGVARPISNLGLSKWHEKSPYDLFGMAIVSLAGFTHFYFDSFIWRVRDAKTREGL